MSRLEDKRAAAKALTPWRDQASDRLKWFLVKVALWGAGIAIICLLSYNGYKGN